MSNELLSAVITGITAGVIGTLVMDISNYLLSRFRLISKIELSMIGRMAAGWLSRRFFYKNPAEMIQVKNEEILGFVTHYAIGISMAIIFVFGWQLFIDGTISAIPAILYGILTTAASWFFVYPSMGLGVCGLKSPEKIKATFSSLANHLFYGIGLAIGLSII